jgi:hypothetical protein
LQDIVERDDPENLKFCNFEHCLKEQGGANPETAATSRLL